MAKDPNEIGVLWLDEYNGRTYLKGAAFEVPSNGLTVDLIPFTFQRKDGSGEGCGLRVIRVVQAPESVPAFDEL